MIDKFNEYFKKSERVLITSHISPDPDSVSSLLLLGTALKLNLPDKQVRMILEEEPDDMEFLAGYKDIEIVPLLDSLAKHKPDLLILLDGNNYERFSRHNGSDVREYVKTNGLKTIIIDHHELEGADKSDVYINNNSPATVQDVYNICFNELKLKMPDGYAQTTMIGLYADTGGFAYVKDGSHKKLFSLVEELISSGADVEATKNLLSRYSEEDMRVLGELIKNLSHQSDYTYSFLPDEFVLDKNGVGKLSADLRKGTGVFLDEFIRNIDGRQWGFIVYRNILQGDGMYSVSLRSAGNSKDVSKIALSLGGGGHKPAAGAKFEANSVEDAIKKVQQAISSV